MENELWKYLKETDKPIVLYGMGNGADKIISVLEKNEIEFKGIFASDGFVRNKVFHGHIISSYRELKNRFGDMIVLLCFGSSRDEVLENVIKIKNETELFAPDVPVISGDIFTLDYYEQNKPRFDKIFNLLADDLSRKTFINTIKYKISGKIDYLFDCETTPDEPYESFLKLLDNEIFLDLGAYNGDTVLDFINRVNSYENIIAVEADCKTFKKLIKLTEHLKNIECKNLCISDKCGLFPFGMKHGRNSSSLGTDSLAEFITVDELLKDKKVSFIKMDIEGEELNAISGAENTIKTQKPKMLISCYHKTEDLFTLPEKVFSIRNDYKIYMRHFKGLPAWDINYYFI
ncbi:MAG: FkbM family methyltransferase [Clostridia bacterium]|nr:FkbM family methyltransferase [Clostridia bacterium]